MHPKKDVMQTIRLTDHNDPLFEMVWQLYTQSFPLSEQRTIEHQCTAFKSDLYHFDIYLEGEQLLGLIGYWLFPDYLYIEHYAINTALRGQGLGSRILNDLQQKTDRTIILEIDEVIDDISTRRLRFYQHLGFVMNPYYHQLPKYRLDPSEHTQARLMILTYPKPIDLQTYEQFNSDLNQIVMKRE